MDIKKNRNITLVLLSILLIIYVGIGYIPKGEVGVETSKTDSTCISNSTGDSLVIEMERIIDSTKLAFDDNFGVVYSQFYSYNKNIDTNTVNLFVGVSSLFKLDTNQENFRMYVGQILLESGAKHMRNDTTLMRSKAGAVGLCQIMPNTCRGALNNLDRESALKLRMLDVTDYSFIYNDTLSKTEINNSCVVWLSNVRNNIALWGLITSKSFGGHKNIYKQLVAYNMGESGLNSYLKDSGDVFEHNYVKMIQSKLMTSK